MPQVEDKVIKLRAQKLRQLQSELLHNHLLQKIGCTQDVLIEADGQGYSDDYCRVQTGAILSQGEVHRVNIKAVRDNKLIADQTL